MPVARRGVDEAPRVAALHGVPRSMGHGGPQKIPRSMGYGDPVIMAFGLGRERESEAKQRETETRGYTPLDMHAGEKSRALRRSEECLLHVEALTKHHASQHCGKSAPCPAKPVKT